MAFFGVGVLVGLLILCFEAILFRLVATTSVWGIVAVVVSSFFAVVLSLFFKWGLLQGFLKSQHKGPVVSSNHRANKLTQKP
jgi:hypothetical protein